MIKIREVTSKVKYLGFTLTADGVRPYGTLFVTKITSYIQGK